MPQLDFFTFPHQYLVASLCFCGLYYFNLLYFFPRIKYLYLNRLFTLNACFLNRRFVEHDATDIFNDLLLLEKDIIARFLKKSKKIVKKILLKKISSTIKNTSNNQSLLLVFFIGFVFLFIFLKNFLIFNAEKLMLIYFLIISISLIIFLKSFLNTVLLNDLKKFLLLITESELESNKNFEFLREYLLKLKINNVQNQLELLLLKNLELKLVKKIK